MGLFGYCDNRHDDDVDDNDMKFEIVVLSGNLYIN